jgi:uncharacterized UBP type Zn finger protein
MADCVHLREAGDPAPLAKDECITCVSMGRDDWVHLRKCLQCGFIGCCDSSPLKHATAHYHETEHPVVRSFEPGETWRWCYVDEVLG